MLASSAGIGVGLEIHAESKFSGQSVDYSVCWFRCVLRWFLLDRQTDWQSVRSTTQVLGFQVRKIGVPTTKWQSCHSGMLRKLETPRFQVAGESREKASKVGSTSRYADSRVLL